MNKFLSDWLSHSEYWFSKDHVYDEYITETYGSLLETHTWEEEQTSLEYHLSCIILFDQVPRYVYRKKDPEKKIDCYLEKAVHIYMYLQKNYDLSCLSAIQWSFMALPMRHTKDSSNIIQVIQTTWSRLKNENDPNEKTQYLRFLKACYQRMPLSQKKYIETSVSADTPLCYDLHDFSQYINILHHCPIAHTTQIGIENGIIYRTIEEFIVKNKIKRLLISLSGGVDSLVCSYVLKKLQVKWKFALTAVHIDYTNRSPMEYEFVKDWCIYQKIPLYTRHITEIQRAACMENGLRTTYEDYTKQVRFQTYKDVWNHFCIYPDFPKVLLGHNQDDCFENILTNLCQKSRYENLMGMYDNHIIDDIIFMRPLLSISKKDIYKFAHTEGIPYLHDSTPSWSQRGKIRDKVRPAMEDWNSEMVPALFELVERINEYEDISESCVKSMIDDTSFNSDGSKEIKLSYHASLFSKTLWKKYFKYLYIPVSYKSLIHFIGHFEKEVHNNIQQSQVMLNKNTKIKIYMKKEHIHIKICHTNEVEL